METFEFPQVGPKPSLTGVDQADLLYLLADVRGKSGEPIPRLTPLGWTCIGKSAPQADTIQANFTFLVSQDSHELNTLVCPFWDIEEPKEVQTVRPEEKLAKNTVVETFSFEDGRYSVGLPWQTKRPQVSR